MLLRPTLADAPLYHFDPHQWIPTAHGAIRGGAVAAAVLVIGLVITDALRRYKRGSRIVLPLLIGFFTLAIYIGIAAAKPDRLLDRTDYATLWFSRIVAAALLFCALRFIDRLLIVPFLSRGSLRGEKAPASRIIHQIVNTIIIAVAIMIFGAYAFDWNIQGFLAGSAVVSIVIGLALQETLGNFLSGLVMHASRPFSVGDWVGVADLEGRVVDMSWRAVTIRTIEDDDVIVPNGTVAREKIINYHQPSTAGARVVEVGLDYAIPPGQATAVLQAAAAEADGVLPEPHPKVFLHQFADSAIVYRIKFWIDKPASHLLIEHRVRSNIWYRLKQNGMSIPYPMRVVEQVHTTQRQAAQQQAAIEHRTKAIEQVPIFAPLSLEQRQAMAAGANDVLLGPGQTLFHQGEAGDSLFIIRSGEVEVLAGNNGQAPARVASLKAGDFFGEMSALTGQPRSATIRATTDLSCVEICKSDLATVFTADPSIMEKISGIVADRTAARAASLAGTDAPAATTVESQRQSLLGRMRGFFARGR